MASRLSPAQIYAVARQAGFNAAQAITATAIALAESGGNPNSHNSVPPDDSYGLWQINMIGSMGPARRAQFGLSSDADLFDPLTNARAAYAISHQGSNFTPWTTYTTTDPSRSYKSHLAQSSNIPYTSDAAQAGLKQEILDSYAAGNITQAERDKALKNLAASAAGVAEPGLGLPNPLSWMDGLLALAKNLLDPRFWLRIGQGLAAAVLLLIGAGLVFRRDAISALGAKMGEGAAE